MYVVTLSRDLATDLATDLGILLLHVASSSQLVTRIRRGK